MTLRIDYPDNCADRRIVSDDENPRVYREEWRCRGCGAWIALDELVWADDQGKVDTDRGAPWCVSCLPASDG